MNLHPRVSSMVVGTVLATAASLALAAASPERSGPSFSFAPAERPTPFASLDQPPPGGFDYSQMRLEKVFGGRVQSVAISGTLIYAAVGLRLAVIDASDPMRPAVIGSLMPIPIIQYDLWAWGDFLVGKRSNELVIFDVSVTSSPRLAARYTTQDWGFDPAAVVGSTGFDFLMAGDRAFLLQRVRSQEVAARTSLVVIELTALPALRLVANQAWPTNADVYLRATNGRQALLAESSFQGPTYLTILDVSEPSRQRRLAQIEGLNPTSAAMAGHYAYAASRADFHLGPAGWPRVGIGVYDLGDPARPVELAFITSTTVSQIPGTILGAIDERLLVLASGFRVFDVSNPADPRETGYLGRQVSYVGGRLAVSEVGGLTYEIRDSDEDGLRLVDMADPDRPRLAGHLPIWNPAQIQLSGSLVVAHSPERGLTVMDPDQRDGLGPLVVGASVGLSDAGVVAIDSRQLIIQYYRRLAERTYDASAGLRIVDTSDPLNPRETGRVDVQEWPAGTDVVAIDGPLWLRRSKSGVVGLYDFADPEHPRLVATIPRAPDDDHFGPPVLGSGLLFLARGSHGLDIFDVTNPSAPRLVDNYSKNSIVAAAVTRVGVLAVDATWTPAPHVGPVLQRVRLAVLAKGPDGRFVETDAVDLPLSLPVILQAQGDTVFVGASQPLVFRLRASGKITAQGQLPTFGCHVANFVPRDRAIFMSTSDCGLLVLSHPDLPLPEALSWHAYMPAARR